MAWLLDILFMMLGDYGVAIVVLSLLVRASLLPLTSWARGLEEREAARQAEMAPELEVAKAGTRGRERFERIDIVYQKHGYHPIKSLSSVLALAFQIPFLLAALFMLSGHPGMVGTTFGPIQDLSQPDRLIAIGTLKINLLPIALTGIAIAESLLLTDTTRITHLKFLFVALVILILIYPFSASVSIYWLSSNFWSLCLQIARRKLP